MKPAYYRARLMCPRCSRTFPLKKSLLRHLRTVHEPKAFSCPECELTFIRKDTRDRHVTEQHKPEAALVKCNACGKQISDRAFVEHLDSRVCCEARAIVSAGHFDGIEFKYPGQDDDAFLVTVRLFLKSQPTIFRVERGEPQVKLDLFETTQPQFEVLTSQSSGGLGEWYRLQSDALRLLLEQLEKDTTALHRTDALWCTTHLLSIISLATPDLFPSGATRHLQGAEAMLRYRHSISCSCEDYTACQRWRKPTPRDSAVALVRRLLRERGIAQYLGDLYRSAKLKGLGRPQTCRMSCTAVALFAGERIFL